MPINCYCQEKTFKQNYYYILTLDEIIEARVLIRSLAKKKKKSLLDTFIPLVCEINFFYDPKKRNHRDNNKLSVYISIYRTGSNAKRLVCVCVWPTVCNIS